MPKSEEKFNEKLKISKKSITPTFEIDRYQRKRYIEMNPMPS